MVQEKIRADKKVDNLIYSYIKRVLRISKGFKIKHIRNRIEVVRLLLFHPTSLVANDMNHEEEEEEEEEEED